jgi:hypothetical protein
MRVSLMNAGQAPGEDGMLDTLSIRNGFRAFDGCLAGACSKSYGMPDCSLWDIDCWKRAITDLENQVNTYKNQVVAGAADPANIITRATVDTAYLPQVVLDHPLAPKQGPSGNTVADAFLKMLKPKFTLNFVPPLPSSYSISPWGDPGDTKWSWVKWGGIIGGAALAYYAVRGFMK